MLLVRLKPSVYLPTIMIIWGALTCVMAVIQEFKHLVVLRILVGTFESGFSPGIILIISSWYKRDEQSKRFGIYISAAILSGAFGGLLAGSITGGMEGTGGLRGWRWLFIIEGVATILWACVAYFILLDFPANSNRLTDRERAIAIARLREGGVKTHVDGEKRIGKIKSFRVAICDRRTMGFICGYMVSTYQSIESWGCAKISPGHRRLFHSLLLLPHPREWSRLHIHRSSAVHDCPYLRSCLLLYGRYHLLLRLHCQSPRTRYRRLADFLTHHIDPCLRHL